jgi:hypothetical protein
LQLAPEIGLRDIDIFGRQILAFIEMVSAVFPEVRVGGYAPLERRYEVYLIREIGRGYGRGSHSPDTPRARLRAEREVPVHTLL